MGNLPKCSSLTDLSWLKVFHIFLLAIDSRYLQTLEFSFNLILGATTKATGTTKCLLLQLFKFFLHRKPKNSVEFKLMMHCFFKMFAGLLSKMERNIFPSHRSCQTQRGAVTIRRGGKSGLQNFGGGKVELHLLSSLYVTSFRLRHEALVGHEKGLHAQMLSGVINKWQHNLEYTSFCSRKSSYSTDKLNDIPNIPYNELKWPLSREVVKLVCISPGTCSVMEVSFPEISFESVVFAGCLDCP